MLEDNVKAVVSCKSFKGGNNISVLKLSKQVQRLCSCVGYECSYMDELNGRGLPNRYFHRATEFNVVDLLVPLCGFPRCSELKGAIRRRSDSPSLCLSCPSRGI
jgi:hypothetical protein